MPGKKKVTRACQGAPWIEGGYASYFEAPASFSCVELLYNQVTACVGLRFRNCRSCGCTRPALGINIFKVLGDKVSRLVSIN